MAKKDLLQRAAEISAQSKQSNPQGVGVKPENDLLKRAEQISAEQAERAEQMARMQLQQDLSGMVTRGMQRDLHTTMGQAYSAPRALDNIAPTTPAEAAVSRSVDNARMEGLYKVEEERLKPLYDYLDTEELPEGYTAPNGQNIPHGEAFVNLVGANAGVTDTGPLYTNTNRLRAMYMLDPELAKGSTQVPWNEKYPQPTEPIMTPAEDGLYHIGDNTYTRDDMINVLAGYIPSVQHQRLLKRNQYYRDDFARTMGYKSWDDMGVRRYDDLLARLKEMEDRVSSYTSSVDYSSQNAFVPLNAQVTRNKANGERMTGDELFAIQKAQEHIIALKTDRKPIEDLTWSEAIGGFVALVSPIGLKGGERAYNKVKKNWELYKAGFDEGFDWLDFASFQLAELFNDSRFNEVANKVNSGQSRSSLSDEEQTIYDCWKIMQEADAIHEEMYGGRNSLVRKVGYGVGYSTEMIPEFALGMGLTGGIGSGVNLGRQTLSQFFKNSSKRAIGSYIGKKAGVYAARSAVAAPATPMMWSNYVQRRNQQFSLDADGNLVKEEKPWAKDLAIAYVETFNEYFSEYLGYGASRLMDVSPTVIGRVVGFDKWAGKLGLDNAMTYVRAFTPSPKTRAIWRNMGFSGTITEAPSEILGDFMSSLMLAPFSEEHGFKQFADPQYWKEMYLTTAIFGGAMSLPSLPGQVKAAYDTNKNIKARDAAMGRIQDEELRNNLKSVMSLDSIEEMSQAMADLHIGDLSPDQAAAAIEYVSNATLVKVATGEMMEDQRMAQMAGLTNILPKLTYKGKDGSLTTDELIEVTDKKGRKLYVVAGDVNNTSDTNMLKCATFDSAGNVITESLLASEVVDVNRSTMDAQWVGAYERIFGAELAVGRLQEIEGARRSMENPSGEVVRAHYLRNGLKVYNTGEEVTLVDGRTATVETLLDNGHYLVRSMNPETQQEEMFDIPFMQVLQPESTMAEAQKKMYADSLNKVAEDIVEEEVTEQTEGMQEETEDQIDAIEEQIEEMPQQVPTREDGKVDYNAINDPKVYAAQFAKDMGDEATAKKRVGVMAQQARAQAEKLRAKSERLTDANEIIDTNAKADALEAKADFYDKVAAEYTAKEKRKSNEREVFKAGDAVEYEGRIAEVVAPEGNDVMIRDARGSYMVVPPTALTRVAEVPTTEVEAEPDTKEDEALIEETESGLVQNVFSKLLDKRTARIIDAMAKALGLKVVFVERVRTQAGTFANADIQGNVVRMSWSQRGKAISFLAGHEFLHRIKNMSEEAYNEFKQSVIEQLGEEEWKRRVDAMRANYEAHNAIAQRTGKPLLIYDDALLEEEVVADYAGYLVHKYHAFDIYLQRQEQQKTQKFNLFRWLRDVFAHLRDWCKRLGARTEAQRMKEMVGKLNTLIDRAIAEAKKKANTPTEVEVSTNANGEVEAITDEQKGQGRFSLSTYHDGGRATLATFLDGRVAEGALTEVEATDMLKELEEIAAVCEELKDKYVPFGVWSEAKVEVDDEGNPVFSVIKANGDYAMNLDFSLVCKKRRTLDAVLNQMVRRGMIKSVSQKDTTIAKINEVIRKYGFETACALCFVDARRFQVIKTARKFCDLYNDTVDFLIPKKSNIAVNEFNFAGRKDVVVSENSLDTMGDDALNVKALRKIGYKVVGKTKDGKDMYPQTVVAKIARHLVEHPEDRKHLSPSDFVSTAGFDKVKAQKPEIMKLYNAKKGTGGPKAAFSDVQYLNDIIRSNWKVEEAYAVGGVRLQSFSDYVPRMVFDYIQMVAELAAKKLPVHAYTKEPLFAKTFGLTGMKINLSLVPDVVEGGVTPGLDAEGNYVWKKNETFPYEEAVELQNAEGYKNNCGTIAVGISDEHIWKMLDDANIRMVIPYHKSGLPKQVAKMNNVAAFTDYTKEQNTRNGGRALTKEEAKQVPNYNELLRETNDPRKAAQAYLDWCAERGYTPKFEKFAGHPNYYKLLEDFTTLVDETYVPQQGVTFTFPTENYAFGSLESLIEQGLEEDAILEGQRDVNVGAIVEEVGEVLGVQPKFSLIGEIGAANLDRVEEAATRLDNLAIAREMETAGKDAMAIKMATGWERGADGLWRYEIMEEFPNDMVKRLEESIDKKISLRDLLGESPILLAYPQLADIPIYVEYKPDSNLFGGYNANNNTITVNVALASSENVPLDETLVHEIQHAIQKIEGFSYGSNLYMVDGDADARAALYEMGQLQFRIGDAIGKDVVIDGKADFMVYHDDLVEYVKNNTFTKAEQEALELLLEGGDMKVRDMYRIMAPAKEKYEEIDSEASFDQYNRVMGEVEARNTSKRLGMTPEERRATLFAKTEDVAREDQIYMNILADEEGLAMGAQSEARYHLSNPYGGNSGYVGYSMSKRAAEAREEGRYPKSDFKKVYDMPQATLDALVNAGVINDKEWHHTSVYGNKTTFYGWGTYGESPYMSEYYKAHKAEIDEAAKNHRDLTPFLDGFEEFEADVDANEAYIAQLKAQAEAEREAQRREEERLFKERINEEKREREDSERKRAYVEANLPAEFVASNGVTIKPKGYGEYPAYRDGEAITSASSSNKRKAASKARAEFKEQIVTPLEESYASQNDRVNYSLRELDAPYLDAVARGDMETAQRMVLEAAKLAMPNTKVVDEDGNPKVVYHQTNASVYINRETGQNWDELDWRERMEWDERDDWDDYWEEREFNTFSRVNARTTNEFDGFFFAPEYDEYHEYGDRTISAFLNITNPASNADYNIDSSKNNAGQEERLRLQQEGYDGVIREYDGEVDEYIAFEPNQIKSADPVTYDDAGNVIPLSERFNPKKEDIRYSISEEDARFERKTAFLTDLMREYNIPLPTFIAQTSDEFLSMVKDYFKLTDDEVKKYEDRIKAIDGTYVPEDDIILMNGGVIRYKEQMSGCVRHEFAHYNSKYYLLDEIRMLANSFSEDVLKKVQEEYLKNYTFEELGKEGVINEIISYLSEEPTMQEIIAIFEGRLAIDEYIEKLQDLIEQREDIKQKEVYIATLPLVKKNIELQKQQYGEEKGRIIVIPRSSTIRQNVSTYARGSSSSYTDGNSKAQPRSAEADRRGEGADAQEVDYRHSLEEIINTPSDEEHKQQMLELAQQMERDAESRGLDLAQEIADTTGWVHLDDGTWKYYGDVDITEDAAERTAVRRWLESKAAVRKTRTRKMYDDLIKEQKKVVSEMEAERKGKRTKKNYGKAVDAILQGQAHESLPIEDQILVDIALGQKLRWEDEKDGKRRGLKSELGLRSAKAEGMRGVTGGNTYVEDYVAAVMERNNGYENGIDDNDVRNAVIEVFGSYPSRKAALEELSRRYPDAAINEATEALDRLEYERNEALAQIDADLREELADAEANPAKYERVYEEESSWNMQLDIYTGALQKARNELSRAQRDMERAELTQREKAVAMNAVRSAITEMLRGDLGRYTRKRDIQALMNAVNEAQTMYAMMRAVDKALMTINDLRLRKEKSRMNNLLKLRIVLNETNLDPLIFMENIMKRGGSTVSAVRRLMDNYWRGVNASGVDVAKGVDGDTGIVMQFIRDHVNYDKLFGTTGVSAEAIADYCDRLRKELRGEETGQEPLLNTKQINTFSEELRERMEEAVSLIEGYLNVQSELKGMDIYSGVSNAQQEIESIQAEIKKLNEEIKELTDQKVAVTDGRIVDAKKEIEAKKKEIQRLNREIASARMNNAGMYIGDMPWIINRMYQLNSSLESILKGGRADLSAFNAKKEKRRKELVNMTLEAIDASEETMSKDYPEYSVWQKIRANSVVHFFTQHLGSMDHMLRRADRNAPNGEGILYNFFMPRLTKAKNSMYTGIMEIADRMSAKTKALFGKEFNSLMRKAEGIILGKISVTHADGKKETYEYTLSNALYTLAIWDQSNGQESLRRQGFTDEHINQLREWLKANDPKWLEFEEWVVNDLLPSMRTKYNKVYREINGVDMDFVDAYFPIRRLDSSIPQSVDIAAPDFENKPSVMTGAIIKRTNNKLPIDVRTSFFGALQDHVKEMEEWAAMAPIIQDFNMILSNPKVRKAMDAVDERFFRDFSEAAKVATLNYTGDKRKLDSLFWQMALRTWASRLLGFKAFTALKQLTSSVLFMPYSANPKYMGRLIWYYLGFGGKGTLTDAMFEKIGLGNLVVKSEGEPWFNIKWAMENSAMFRRRWESGVAGNDIFQRELKYNERTKWGRFVRRAGEIIDNVQHLAMSPIALVDAYTVAAGMRAIYDFEMANLLKQGYSETEARKIAMFRAEVAANKTQQSSESEYLAPIQKNGGFISAFTIFQNAPFAQGRMIAEAWNELTRDYKKEVEFIYKQELARIKRENAAEIEAVEATITKEKEAGVITNTKEENIRRAQLMKPINERMEREAQAIAEKRENKAKLKAVRTLVYNAFIGQAIFNLAGQLPYLLFGDDDEKKRKIREELNWLTLFAPMGTVVGGGQIMSILGGHKVEFSGALAELQEGINDIAETAQKEGIFDAMLVAGDFLVKKGLGLDLDSFYKVYSGIENMFEDGMSAEAILLALNGPESQVRLLAGDRKEGETVEEYATRIMRLYTIFSDPEYSDYYNTKGSFIGDEPAGRMTKTQMREMHKQYEQAYRSDVMRNKGLQDEWKEFVELEEEYAEAMEHLFKSSKPSRNSGYVDGEYRAPIDGLSEEDFSTLKYLALYATETMKYAENYIGQDEDTYLELVRAEAEAKREFMEEYNKIIDK